jgi:hypothetical protein
LSLENTYISKSPTSPFQPHLSHHLFLSPPSLFNERDKWNSLIFTRYYYLNFYIIRVHTSHSGIFFLISHFLVNWKFFTCSTKMFSLRRTILTIFIFYFFRKWIWKFSFIWVCIYIYIYIYCNTLVLYREGGL